MRISNKIIRRRLLKYAKLFNSMNCMYNFNERIACERVVNDVRPPDQHAEEFNKKRPDHGLPVK